MDDLKAAGILGKKIGALHSGIGHMTFNLVVKTFYLRVI